jgi:hypothetical protein
MLTPIQQLPLTEPQHQVALSNNILAMDQERAALLHQPERGNGVYLLDHYDRSQDMAVSYGLLLALHQNGTGRRRWRFYTHTDTDALERARQWPRDF